MMRVVVIDDSLDRVRVIIQYLLSCLVQFGIQHQSCQTSRKGRYEDVDTAIDFDVIVFQDCGS